ncbi:MAG: MFS transporter [Actinomycetota bacterium]|nr:MFS transporter [Actinomycetota bacterium]
MSGDGAAAAAPASFRDVFASRDFQALWAAVVLSRVGDQLTTVALSILVYHRTDSPFLTAVTYAITFLPWLIGGPFLAGLADRLPRRPVMVVCDLVRAGLAVLLALGHLPLPLLFVVLLAIALLDPPFSAAQAAVLPDILPGDRYVMGSSVINVTYEIAQVAGFVAGGVLVALIGPRQALLVDAATYAVSALLLGALRVPHHAAGNDGDGTSLSMLQRAREGARLVFGAPQLRRLTALASLCAFYVVPEALAVPYADHAGAGEAAAGLLLGANPAGTVVGSLLLARAAPPTRMSSMGPLAVVSCAPLIACAVSPQWSVVAVLLFVSGLGSAYNLPANAAFMAAVPPQQRGQAFGLVGAGMAGGQGLALLLAGAAAHHMSPGSVIAAAGVLGTVAALLLAVQLRREPVVVTA